MVLGRLIPQEAELAPEVFRRRSTGARHRSAESVKGEIQHGGGQKSARDDTA